MSGRALRAVALLVAVVLLAAYAVARVRVSADFAAFLPAGADPTQRALIQQLREGAAGRLVLIELSGAPPGALAAASQALRARLATEPAFRYAANGDALAARREVELIGAQRYALSRRLTTATFTVEGLRAALAERLEGLYGSAAPLEGALLAQDPTGETLAILRSLAPAQAPRSVDGVWFDPAGARALLVAETVASAADLDGQAAAVAALVASHAAAGGASSLSFSSPGTLAVASRAAIAREAGILSVVSALLILGVLAWTYRSPRPVLLCALPAAAGLLAGVCAVHWGIGRLNGITLAFGATLLGEAVDYPSFLFTQVAPGEAPAQTRMRVGPLLRLAVLTTACGSVALLAAGFPGLVELGVLTLVGVLVAGVVTWWGVADWIPTNLGRALPALPDLPGRAAWRLPLRPAWRMGLLALAVVVVALVDQRRVYFDDDPAHLNPLPAALAAADRGRRAALGAPDVRNVILVRGGTVDDVLARCERLRATLDGAVAADALAGFDLVSDIVPSAAAQARRRAALPDAPQLERDLALALTGTPFRADAFAPFLRDVAAARVAAPVAPATLAGTALGLRAAALLGTDADGAYAVVPLRGVKDAAALGAMVRAMGEPEVTTLDLRTAAATMLAAYRQRALVATAAGVALILAVLAIGLRDLRRAGRVLAPVLAGTLLAAGLLVAGGTPLTLFHLVALLLVVGIGVNYGLFADRASTAPGEGVRVVRTLLVVSATTLCAFATLAVSSIPVLHALGTTVCAGVAACLAAVAFVHAPLAPSSRGR